jgi:protoheme IX farnesyltransferase
MFLEREHDRNMRRTQGRPLPAGRLAPKQVLAFGAATSLGGLTWLWLATSPLATAVCATIVVTYVAVYTPLKRVTSLNTLVGAVPGALPPVVGYAASHGGLNEQALVLFLIVFFWQIPHFLSIAWRHREDYEKGGMLMLPVVDPGGASTSRQMVGYTGALISVSLAAYLVELSGPLYLAAAVCLGLLFLAPVLMAAVFRVESAMRLCFLASIVYLPLLLGIMVLDRRAFL